MEHREVELIDSFTGDQSNLTRLAHFLIPTEIIESPSPSPPDSVCITPCPRGISLPFLSSKFRFRDYFEGDIMWKNWAKKLHSEYELKWKEVGVYEAIGTSAYETLTDSDVIIAVAEKWCSETNTFIFPWGEATVTLEDVNVLGGFSVLGDCVNNTPVQDVTDAEQALNAAFCDICLEDGDVPRTRRWMEWFKGQSFEHEAFITLWLSRFVFPSLMSDSVNKKVIPIAVRLAEGHRIALAPAVLASIYKALTTVKNRILEAREVRVLKVYEPLYLVQLWVWERFLALRPRPNHLNRPNVPRIALWRNVYMSTKNMNVRLALDTAGESFVWRPYMSSCNGWLVHPLFKDDEQWILTDFVSSHLSRDIDAFDRCLRVCELVGFGGFVQKYLPNRVAMQFGFDQDVPKYIHSEFFSEVACRDYSKPLANRLIYIPSRITKSCVTKRYLEWWRQSVLPQLDLFRKVTRRSRSIRNRRKRCYEKEPEEVLDSMWLDGLTPKQAKYYMEWSKKARLLREEPDEMDEVAATVTATATTLLHENGTVIDQVQDGLKGDDNVGINKDDEVREAKMIELELVNKKLTKRVSELEMLVDFLRSKFLSKNGINKVLAK